MISQGLRVLRFLNQQILNNPEDVLREIQTYLETSPGRDIGDKKSWSVLNPHPDPLPKGEGDES